MTQSLQLYLGQIRRIDEEGQFTGIYKFPADGPRELTREGFVGDQQADRRVHGGPEKAVHHYPARNYPRLAREFPHLAEALIPGSMGENISTAEGDEETVHIGDIYRLDSALVQVSQPRTPCWKIDYRYGIKGLTQFIAATGLTGWYYRVLEPGRVAPGAPWQLAERPAGTVPLAELLALWRQHRPDLDTLARLGAAPCLNASWQKKISDRLAWLKANQ